VQFRWLQTGISIRHADTVDVKFLVTPQNAEPVEKVIALPNAALLTMSANSGHKLTDPFCMRLAAVHLKHMIETGEDMDKTLVTISASELDAYERQLKAL
jgi:alkyl sulfatase BDS1-like metallo-beta-lactamase superfamily hydrolase